MDKNEEINLEKLVEDVRKKYGLNLLEFADEKDIEEKIKEARALARKHVILFSFKSVRFRRGRVITKNNLLRDYRFPFYRMLLTAHKIASEISENENIENDTVEDSALILYGFVESLCVTMPHLKGLPQRLRFASDLLEHIMFGKNPAADWNLDETYKSERITRDGLTILRGLKKTKESTNDG